MIKKVREVVAAVGLLVLVLAIPFLGTTLFCAARNWLDDCRTCVWSVKGEAAEDRKVPNTSQVPLASTGVTA